MAAEGNFFVYSVLIFTIFSFCQGDNIPGVVPLNSATFDKVVSKFQYALVKFDKPHSYGDKMKAFKAFVPDTIANDRLLVATVGVKDQIDRENMDLLARFRLTKDELPVYLLFIGQEKPVRYQGDLKQADAVLKWLMGQIDYGDKENSDLAERFSVKKDDFPVYLLFTAGSDKPARFSGDVKQAEEIKKFLARESDWGDNENQDIAERYEISKDDYPVYMLFVQGQEPVRYEGNTKSPDAIKKFLIRESGLWLGLPACIEEFDHLLKDFFKSDFKSEREKIVVQARQLAEGVKEEGKKTRANVYVKTMEKVIEKGDDFIEQEIARVDKLRTEKVSDKKKDQLRDRSSILTSFQMRMKGQLLSHEEL